MGKIIRERKVDKWNMKIRAYSHWKAWHSHSRPHMLAISQPKFQNGQD